MWHMDWLADEIGEMGAEPEMKQGVYPHDPTSNASLLRSYIEWEEGLVKAYAEQAAQVDKADVKRILLQQSRESAIHARRFAAMLEKLGPEAEEPLVYEDTGNFSPGMSDRLRQEMSDEYRLVLQHLRHAFVFEEDSCPVSSELELTAMRHMKHLSHFAEELAESGHELQFVDPSIDMSRELGAALEADIELTKEARERFVELGIHPEIAQHRGLKTELDHMVFQEEFLTSAVSGLLGEASAAEAAEDTGSTGAEDQASDDETTAGPSATFTVGSLIDKD
jgi:rubrerythrin